MNSEEGIAKFEAKYALITHDLKGYVPEIFAQFITRRLRKVESANPSQYGGRFPWNYLLLLKLIWIYSDHFPYKVHSEKSLDRLMNWLFDLGEIQSPFLAQNTVHGLFKFLRTIANQQFWTQRSMGQWNIARQCLLFDNLPSNDPIGIAIKKSFKLEIKEILQLLFVTWGWMAGKPDRYIFDSTTFFNAMDFSQVEVQSFFDSLSLDRYNANEYLTSNKPVRNSYFETFERSPFIKKPFLKIDEKHYLCYSEKLIQECVNTLAFYFVAEQGRSSLKEEFADLVEGYVGKTLASASLDYKSENQLRKLFPGSKVTDFLIEDENCNLFVEVKTQDISEYVRVFPGNQQLANELQDSVTKAVIQGYELISRVCKSDSNQGSRKNYLAVVTYIQFDLGHGKQFFDEFMGAEVSPFLESKGIDPALLPPENIFVLDIEEWDMFVTAIFTKRIDLPSFLAKVVEENSKPETMKFHFGQHLDQYIEDFGLPILDSRFQEFTEELQKRFKIQPDS